LSNTILRSGKLISSKLIIGIGDDNCWGDHFGGNVGSEECENEDDVCFTELLVDWLPRGAQQATIRRGCISKDSRPGNECLTQDTV